MYAKYVSTVTATRAQVINDLCLLVSGSAVSALSTGCDKLNTTLLSTVAPGWTLIDSAAPQSGCVISAPDIDGLTTKYVSLRSEASTGIEILAYEGWNAATHVGVNVKGPSVNPSASTVGTLNFVGASINTYVLFATPRSFYIHSLTLPANAYGIGAFEFTREAEYLKGTTYPCFGVLTWYVLYQSTNYIGGNADYYVPFRAGIPRMKNLFGAGDITGVSSAITPASMFSRYANLYLSYAGYGTVETRGVCGAPYNKLVDATETPYIELRPLWAVYPPYGVFNTAQSQPVLGKFFDLVEIAPGLGNTLDTFNDGTFTYAIINIGTSSFAFKIA